MRRLRRWLFNGIAALSLLLFVATATLWMRSMHTWDDVWDQIGSHLWSLRTGRGRIGFDIWNSVPLGRFARYSYSTEPANGYRYAGEDHPANFWEAHGFFYMEYRTRYVLITPLWCWCVIFLLLPTKKGLNRYYRGRVTEQGSCATCGYDLRATPNRCPECGSMPPQNKSLQPDL
jgi:hypothetical protein